WRFQSTTEARNSWGWTLRRCFVRRSVLEAIQCRYGVRPSGEGLPNSLLMANGGSRKTIKDSSGLPRNASPRDDPRPIPSYAELLDRDETIARVKRSLRLLAGGPRGQESRSLPDKWDERDRALLEQYLAESDEWRREFEGRLTSVHADKLHGFGVRAASLAVRKLDPHFLELSALALALASTRAVDWRDVWVVMPLPYRTARFLGADPQQLFRKAVAPASDMARHWVERFLGRAEGEVLSNPWVASHDNDGFIWAYPRAQETLQSLREWLGIDPGSKPTRPPRANLRRERRLSSVRECLEELRPASIQIRDRKLPHDRDLWVQKVLERYIASPYKWRRLFDGALARDQAWELETFGVRAAAWAVRASDTHYLELSVL